ncbi:phage/plasmid primase, P4 family [Aestuariivirga sp.]|uniref:phage/plasmid primase, P4 family n=1 Tax=Aestuariivirga sp. TaxID=2650926 RepID=UPI0035932556
MLDLRDLKQADIDTLLALGIAPTAIVHPYTPQTCTGVIYRGVFEETTSGPKWIVFGGINDLILWNPQTGSLTSEWGHSFALGEEVIDNPASTFDGWLRIFADTSAHALFFLYGLGANGKSVFIDTLAGVLGDYHKTAPIETFTASSGDRHPTDLAGLRGARLVTATETEEGRRWAEAKIKQLTGGDKISARFMRQDFFEYVPQFKLLVAGNHKPGLRSVDEAIRRRFHLLPFTVTIPAEERDLHLKDKLKAEWPGILSWAVQGCLDWQRVGLNPPEAVKQATAAYLEAEDATAAWLDDCCIVDPQAWESSADLFSSWKTWAEKAGEPIGSSKSFVAKLETRGFRENRKRHGRGYTGYSINPTLHAPHWSDVQA